MNRHLLCCCLLTTCIGACGGSAELIPGTLPADAGTHEAPADGGDDDVTDAPLAEVSFADSMEDAAPAEFCSGVAKARWGVTVVESPVITTSRLYLDCCEGALVRLHTKAALGFDYAVTVVGAWPFNPGDYALNGDPAFPEVTIAVLGAPEQKVSATGLLHVGVPTTTDMRIGFCLEAQGDQVPGGSRLYVSEAFVAPYEWQQRLAIHLLSDSSITASQASSMPLESLPLAQVPILDMMSIGWYEGAAHIVHWDEWSSSGLLLSQLPDIPLQGLPFVVVADGQRVYLGAFMSMISSYALDSPVVLKEEVTDAGFPIHAPMQAKDPRSDPRIIKVLQESWKLGP